MPCGSQGPSPGADHGPDASTDSVGAKAGSEVAKVLYSLASCSIRLVSTSTSLEAPLASSGSLSRSTGSSIYN
jgi:hypothetical protein